MDGIKHGGACLNVTSACHFDRRLEHIMMARRDFFLRRVWFSVNPQLTAVAGMIIAIAPLVLCYVISAWALASDLYVGSYFSRIEHNQQFVIVWNTFMFISLLGGYAMVFMQKANPSAVALVSLSWVTLFMSQFALISAVQFAHVGFPSSTATSVFAALLAIDLTAVAVLLLREHGALETLDAPVTVAAPPGNPNEPPQYDSQCQPASEVQPKAGPQVDAPANDGNIPA
ncbi:Uncharacterized protein PBTT_06231 [Plasmodiophora brassicae]|uniref:Uncharacterized protein n=1 Tax=Plasmodiophora brassicae TaxID=37360 RepID=A0A0G4IUG5_PLABS|nr:hypothetical protein PBRA_007102 [Plasmodiophora brassicae]SPQ98545.1 unnamed protein product [Plasmodiophora brassicae]